ncbi:MAG: trypsin-like peptidase domain-containing protein [Planctomycetes bacterium]|nr:trypsin-like peptidase domain-containing protein [Planctomycetota bacterium]
MFKKILKGVLKVVVEALLMLVKKKVEDKLDDLNRPKKGLVIRLLIIILTGIALIGLTAWATKLPELPSGVIIIRPLDKANNPYQREYEDMLYPTVRITTKTGTGSGVILTTKDTKDTKNTIYILTAAHVVGNYKEVDVIFYEYSHQDTKTLNASVVLTDTNKDLALLQIRNTKSEIRTARLAPRDYAYYLFTPVYVVGCSLGLNPRPSSGIVSAINFDSVEITAPILPGNSGGPVYDAKTHELIGIAVWVRLYGDQLITTMAGIVPINQVYDFLESFKLEVTGFKTEHETYNLQPETFHPLSRDNEVSDASAQHRELCRRMGLTKDWILR